MRTRWIASLLVGLVVAAPSVRADDETEARAIVAKGIKALGGEAKLKKIKALTLKFKGKVYVDGNTLNYTAEVSYQLPGQSKSVISSEVNGMAFTITRVLNKDKGWMKINTDTNAFDKAELAEEKEQMYAQGVSRLVTLNDKAYKLSSVGEVKVGKHDAVGVKVTSKGHRDVNLYFDKKTGLLVKSESTVKKMGAEMEVSQEVFYEEYKEFDGIKHASKMKLKQDGKKYVDIDETTEITLEEKLDDSVFDKP